MKISQVKKKPPRRRELLAPCPYCGFAVYIGRPTKNNRGRGWDCHTCALFGRTTP